MTEFVHEKVENNVLKVENAGYKPFLTIFSKAVLVRIIYSRDWVLKS